MIKDFLKLWTATIGVIVATILGTIAYAYIRTKELTLGDIAWQEMLKISSISLLVGAFAVLAFSTIAYRIIQIANQNGKKKGKRADLFDFAIVSVSSAAQVAVPLAVFTSLWLSFIVNTASPETLYNYAESKGYEYTLAQHQMPQPEYSVFSLATTAHASENMSFEEARVEVVHNYITNQTNKETFKIFVISFTVLLGFILTLTATNNLDLERITGDPKS